MVRIDVGIIFCMGVLFAACGPSASNTSFSTTVPKSPSTLEPTVQPRTTTTAPTHPNSGSTECKGLHIANPATLYCVLMGYTAGAVDTSQGQAGVCTFRDGTVCDEWAFLRGACGQQYSYCAQKGYGIQTVHDGQDPYSQEYAVCTDPTGGVIGTVTDLSGLQQQLQCGLNP